MKYEHFTNIHIEYSYATRSNKKRRLSRQNKFEGCLLHGPYLGKLSEISEVSLEGDSLRVSMPSIRSCFSPAGFQQDNETGSRTIAPIGDTHCNLSTRHVDYGPDSRNGQMSCNNNYNLLESLGFILNYQKSVLIPSTTTEFLGFLVDSKTLTLSLPKKKIKDSQKGVPINSRQSTVLNTKTFPIVGLPNLHHSGSFSCTNTFSVFTKMRVRLLHQQNGRDQVPNSSLAGKKSLGLVSRTSDCARSPAYPGNSKHRTRQRVPNLCGQQRLETCETCVRGGRIKESSERSLVGKSAQ